MCSRYGIDGSAEREARGGRESRVSFAPIPPLEQPRYAAALEGWRRENPQGARITGRHARNLNPIIHALHGERELTPAWWWLHVGGAPAEYSAFNSRDDKLLRSWRLPFQRRALLPASWYVEKRRVFELPDGELFAIAAITSPVPGAAPRGAVEAPLLSYSMVTRSALAAAATAHHRMPLLLPREFHDEWLDPRRPGDAELVGRALAASDELSRSVVEATAEADDPAPAQPALF